MRRLAEWVERHYTLIVQGSLIAGMALLVVLLAWAITATNLMGTIVAGLGLAVAIVVVGTSSVVPDNLRSQATERTLRLASSTQSVMRGGLTPKNCRRVCLLLMLETQATAIAMTDTRVTLAHVGEKFPSSMPGEPISGPTREVLEGHRMQTFANIREGEWVYHDEAPVADASIEALVALEPDAPASLAQADVEVQGAEDERDESSQHPVGVIVPLIVADQAVGTIKFYYSNGRQIDRTQLAIARGFSELIATQLSTYELERQSELTAQAEVKALQAQINPHFLFNALNTIASFTRTDPTKARNLLREFSSFYRYTLQSTRSLVPLYSELEQVRRYLQIEKARFGEDRIEETEIVEPACESVHIPGFLVQPIVENSVRHGMRDEGTLHIDIQAVIDGDDVMISVADDGLGMNAEVAERLTSAASHSDGFAIDDEQDEREAQAATQTNRGAGVALSNVADRLEHFYGVGSGVEIMSRPGEGTVVTLRLVNAAPFDTPDDGDDEDDDFDIDLDFDDE